MTVFILLTCVFFTINVVHSTTLRASTACGSSGLGAAISNAATNWVEQSVLGLGQLVNIGANDPDGNIFDFPFQGTGSTWAENAMNSTARQILWSSWGQILDYTMNGVTYSFPPWNSVGLVSSVQLFNVDDGSGPGYFWSTPYSSPLFCLVMPNTSQILPTSAGTGGVTGLGSSPSYQVNYHVNSMTGKPTSAYSQQSTNSFQKTFWWASMNASGSTVFTQPLKSPITGFTVFAISTMFETSTGKRGILQCGLPTTFLSGILESLNADATNQVGYIMTTVHPVGLLLGSTTGVNCNITSYAHNSANKLISATAQYIMDNGVTTDSTVYMPSLGCLMTVQFWTYGDYEKVYNYPVGYYLPSSSLVGTPDTGGLQWTIVTCVTLPQADTTVTTDDASSSNGLTQAEVMNGIGAVSVATLILVIAIVFCMAYSLFFAQNKAALASSAKGNDNL